MCVNSQAKDTYSPKHRRRPGKLADKLLNVVQGTKWWGRGAAELELAPQMQVLWATHWLLLAAAQNPQVWAIALPDKVSALKPSQGSDTRGLDGWVPHLAAAGWFWGVPPSPVSPWSPRPPLLRTINFLVPTQNKYSGFSLSQGGGVADSRLLSPEQLTKIN